MIESLIVFLMTTVISYIGLSIIVSKDVGYIVELILKGIFLL